MEWTRSTVKGLHVSCLLLVDVNNLFRGIQRKFGQRKLRLVEYARALENAGHVLLHKIVFSHQTRGSCQRFVNLLEANGFECHFDLDAWTVPAALRTAEIMHEVDTVILGSTGHEVGRILYWAKQHGKRVICFGVDIPDYMVKFAECHEITEDFLSAATPPAEPMDVPANVPSNGA